MVITPDPGATGLGPHRGRPDHLADRGQPARGSGPQPHELQYHAVAVPEGGPEQVRERDQRAGGGPAGAVRPAGAGGRAHVSQVYLAVAIAEVAIMAVLLRPAGRRADDLRPDRGAERDVHPGGARRAVLRRVRRPDHLPATSRCGWPPSATWAPSSGRATWNGSCCDRDHRDRAGRRRLGLLAVGRGRHPADAGRLQPDPVLQQDDHHGRAAGADRAGRGRGPGQRVTAAGRCWSRCCCWCSTRSPRTRWPAPRTRPACRCGRARSPTRSQSECAAGARHDPPPALPRGAPPARPCEAPAREAMTAFWVLDYLLSCAVVLAIGRAGGPAAQPQRRGHGPVGAPAPCCRCCSSCSARRTWRTPRSWSGRSRCRCCTWSPSARPRTVIDEPDLDETEGTDEDQR